MLARLAAVSGFVPPDAPRVDSALADLAVREQLAPLLGWRISRGLLDADPATARLLVSEHRACLAASLIRDSELNPIISAIAAAGIPMLWLKGAALLRTVYAPGARWMGDLDILVPRADYHAALHAALSAGATPHALPTRRLTAAHDYATLLHSPRGAALEIHRSLAPRFLFGDGDTLRPVTNGNHGVPGSICPDTPENPSTPDPSELFVSLAIHAAKHGFNVPFRAIVDGLALAATATANGARIEGAPTPPAPIDLAAVERAACRQSARRATSIWIRMLIRFGLPDADESQSSSNLTVNRRINQSNQQAGAGDPDPPVGLSWSALARRLGDDRLARALAHGAPYGSGAGAAVGAAARALRIARIAASVDRVSAAAGYLANRVAMRLGDAVQAGLHLTR